jgi:hypothetical protein
MALTKKDTPIVWSTAFERSFERLKMFFVLATILPHFDPEGKIVVETDASNLVVSGVLLQYDDDDDILHPVAYFSRKHSPPEINYEIYETELLAIVQAFNEWHPLLEGFLHTLRSSPITET